MIAAPPAACDPATPARPAAVGGPRAGPCRCLIGLVLAVVAATTAGAPPQAVGVVEGTVTVGDVPAPAMIAVTTDRAVCGDTVEDRSAVVGPGGGVANAVVIVTGAPWTTDPPAPSINNRACHFEPRVQVARTRSLVSVTSADDVLHTTHAYDDRARTTFNVALPFAGMTVTRPLRRPGLVRIECDSHGWMRGWVYVTDDVAGVTGPDGRFVLSGIPAGTYEVTVWHERYAASSARVTVPAAGRARVDFRVE